MLFTKFGVDTLSWAGDVSPGVVLTTMAVFGYQCDKTLTPMAKFNRLKPAHIKNTTFSWLYQQWIMFGSGLDPLLLTWFNFNPSMGK